MGYLGNIVYTVLALFGRVIGCHSLSGGNGQQGSYKGFDLEHCCISMECFQRYFLVVLFSGTGGPARSDPGHAA